MQPRAARLGLAVLVAFLVLTVGLAYGLPTLFLNRTGHTLRALLLALQVGVAILLLRARWRVRSAVRPLTMKLAAIACSLFVTGTLLEATFMFVPRSHGIGGTLATRIWFRYYWHPINRLGYRDRDFDPRVEPEATRILVVGDSFTAGHGIARAEDRFSDLLQARLPAPFRVFNLGDNGADTRKEWANLAAFPLKPDILILQYFGNDIDQVAADAGLGFHFITYEDLNALEKRLVTGSYLLNFVFWSIRDLETTGFAESTAAYYGDEAMLAKHLADLAQFVDLSVQQNVPLIVVTFPFLNDLGLSRRCLDPVEQFLASRDVPVVSVSELVRDLPVAARVVNRNNAHASRAVHRRVADALYEVLKGRGLLTEPPVLGR